MEINKNVKRNNNNKKKKNYTTRKKHESAGRLVKLWIYEAFFSIKKRQFLVDLLLY